MQSGNDAEAWLVANEALLDSPFEARFVRDVLARVPGVDWRCVSAQFPFRDSDGRQRYCDFVIREAESVRIAIEIDGYDKTGRGGGMSRAEFTDWQRRHASLVAQGWDVIRFANGDVVSRPGRCVELLALMLRRERARIEHATALARRQAELEHEVANLRAESADAGRLRAELAVTRSLASLAGQAQALSASESQRLKELASAQDAIANLKRETGVMKTAIWAFTVLASLMLFLLFHRSANNGVEPSSPPAAAASPMSSPPSPARMSAGARPDTAGPTSSNELPHDQGRDCSSPVSWRDARMFLRQTVAIEGPVTRIASRQDVRGGPTFIDLGERFPSPGRVGIVVWKNDLPRHEASVARVRVGSVVCVIGRVTLRDGVPQVDPGETGTLQVSP